MPRVIDPQGRVRQFLALVNRLPVGERAVRIDGDYLYVDSVDRLVAALGWKVGWIERHEHDLVAHVVNPGAVAVDVGANIGRYTLQIARRVGESGRVYAIEPEPRNFHLLERAVQATGLKQVQLVRAAASDRPGELALFVSPTNRGDHRVIAASDQRDSITVRSIVLDELLDAEPHVDFVKLDVEGAELAALHGLRRTLERNPQIGILCEVCPNLLSRAGARQEDFFEPLLAAGLVAHGIGAQGVLTPVNTTAAWAAAQTAGFLNFYFRKR